jgi:hypothetical protein
MAIDEVLNASETLETARERISRREAKAVLSALDQSESSCRRCGRQTLAGMFATIEAEAGVGP